MRTVALALLILLISVESVGQAQTNIPAVLHSDQTKGQPPKTDGSRAEQTANVGTPRTGIAEEWFSAVSDQLLQTLACFLDKQSIDNQLAAESKKELNPPSVVAGRVKLLAVLVQKNSRNHCK